MKFLIKFIFQFLIYFSFVGNSYPQLPGYSLQLKNFVLSPDSRIITFDFVITHTNAVQFEYAAGQYFLKVPQSIGDLGVPSTANTYFQYDTTGGAYVTDFPVSMIPRGPTVAATTINGIPYYELRLAANSLPGAGSGLILPQGIPKLVVRMKILAKTGVLNPANANFNFRDSCSDNPISITRTKINAYIGTANTEITRCANHSADVSGLFPAININIKLAVEGLYDSSTDKLLMRDTVISYLRNAISPYLITDSAKAVIDSNTLSGNFSFSHSNTSGLFYIIVKHRNSLETWSKSGGENLVPGNNSYDFTSSASQAYGNNMVLKGSKYCIFSGDVNQDLVIDISDMSGVDNDVYNFAMGYIPTDLNGDYFVDGNDMNIIDNNRLRVIRNPIYGN